MLRINLLPPYIFDKQKKVKLAVLWGIVAAAAIAMFLVWTGSVAGELDGKKKELTEATDFKSQYDSYESQIKKVNDDVAVIRSKQTFIAGAKTNNDAWPVVYEAMRDVTSPVILLESLSVEQANHKALDFVGFAKDELTIARWWMSLRNAKDRFDSVTFNLPSHPYIPPTAANGTGGVGGFGGFNRGGMTGYGGMGSSGMGMPGFSGGGSSPAQKFARPGAAGMAGMGGMGQMSGRMGGFGGMGGGGAGASASASLTEIEGRSGLNFTGVAMVKDTLAPPIAPAWPAGGAAAGGAGGFGGMAGMGGMGSMGMSSAMGGGRVPSGGPAMGAPAAPTAGKGKKGAEGD